MSAEDNAAAEPAEIGEALVAALGFEPTEGKKLGRRVGSSASIVDELSEAENTIVDNTNDAPSVDDAFSVVSTDGEAEEGTTASSGGTGSSSSRSANGATKAPAKKATKSNRQRSRNRKNRNSRNNGRGNNQRSGAAAGTGSGSAGSTQKSDSKTEAKPSLDEIKSLAKPTVSGSDVVIEDGDAVVDGVDGAADAVAKIAGADVGAEVTEAAADAAVAVDEAGSAVASTKESVTEKTTDTTTEVVDDPVARAKAETEAIRKRLADAKRKAGIGDDAESGPDADKADAGSSSATSSGKSAASTKTASKRDDGDKPAGKQSKTAAGDGQSEVNAEKDGRTKTGESKTDVKTEVRAETKADKKTDSGAKSSDAVAAATGAAVTGEIMPVEAEIGNNPPPPSAADAIQAEAVTPAADAVPTSPPAKVADDARVVGQSNQTATAEAKPSSAPATLEADTIAVPVAPPTESLKPQLEPQPAVVRESSWPSLGELPFPNPFRRKRRVQARKVRRVVRHVDPWSVLTFSVLFHLCVFAALLLASVLVWNAAEAAGTIENMETFITDLGDYESFEIKGDVVFKSAVAIAGILTLASSVLLVLLTVVFNLISDLVGGIRLTVIEEETVRVRRKG